MRRASALIASALLLLAMSSAASAACPNEGLRREQGTTRLADCRAYELVSSIPEAQRHSAEVLVNTERSRAAVDGGAFEFSALGAVDGVEGNAIATDYIATRGSGGWSVHSITPPGRAGFLDALGLPSRYVGDMSSDLASGIFFSHVLLGEEGENVSEITNLYLATNLLEPGAPSYRLITDSFAPIPPPGKGEEPELALAAAAGDFGAVLFESDYALTPDAAGLSPSEPKLYKWSDGEVRLVGFLPASEGGGPSVSQAGQGALEHRYTSATLSRGGARTIFTAPPFSSDHAAGNLYLRDDQGTPSPLDDTTVKINVSEKTNGAGPGGTDGGGPQPATFWSATPELDQIFFTSSEALTDDAVENAEQKLYRFEPGKPEGERLTLISVDANSDDGITDQASGAIGSSDDGAYVYFVGSNQLVEGASTTPATRIYLWHEGAISVVAGIKPGQETNQILGTEGGMGEFGGAPKWSRVTPDGRHLMFVSRGSEELTGYKQGNACSNLPQGGCQEVYVYTANPLGGGLLQCASCNPAKTEAETNADIFFHRFDFSPGDPHLAHNLSSDGRYVFFDTPEALTPDDRNESVDVYAFDTTTGLAELISGGGAGGDAHFLDASPDGHDVFFTTRAQLLPGDRNDNVDTYDARIDGGFEEAAVVASPECASAVACRPEGAAGEEPPPASSEFVRPARARHPVRHRKCSKRVRHHRRHCSRRHRRKRRHG